MCVLVVVPFWGGEHWARWTIPGVLVLLYVPILMATLNVLTVTPASRPWYGNAIAVLATSIGFALDQPWSKSSLK